ncbi:MAG: UvrD-helicase domain-containing protein [Balneolaceae bacterium]|nr:UvrD-helicase domain-containing protein [Balneolaceae bacterium]
MHRYQNYLEEQGAADLSNIINQLVNALKADTVWREHLHEKYKAIAIDEFQDINPIQYELVQQFVGKDTSVLAIGYRRRSASYGFRGSDTPSSSNLLIVIAVEPSRLARIIDRPELSWRQPER